jgi:hypothetical protein
MIKDITNKDLFAFIGEKVKYDEWGGGYIWGIHKNEKMEMVAQVDEPEKDFAAVMSVRGWGAIQNLCKDDETYAARFQDFMGNFIAEAINEKIQRENKN